MPCKSFPDKIIKQMILHFLHLLKRIRDMSMANLPASPKWRNTNSNATFSTVIESDEDRKISKQDELHSLFRWLGGDLTSVQVAERAMKDMDEGETVEYSEFMKLMEMEKNEGEDEEDMRKAFEVFEDGEGDANSCITSAGLQLALSRLGEVRSFEECAAMIRAYDLDGDGVLDFHEFRTMMIR